MALDFPNSPSLNDTVELGGKTYQWDGVKWRMVYVTTPTASTAAPTITIVTEAADGVTFTLTNNDDNTALISYEVDGNIGGVELAAAATSSNITVALSAGTYTLSAFATVVGEVATQSTSAVEIVAIPTYELLYSETVATNKTQIDITGLNIGKDDTLVLTSTLVTDDGHGFLLYVNGNTTNSNYTYQLLGGNGSSISAGRGNFPYFTIGRNGQTFTKTNIKVSNNDRYVFQSNSAMRVGANSSSIENMNINAVCTSTVTSITSLSIVAGAANKIFANSKFTLYKVTEAA